MGFMSTCAAYAVFFLFPVCYGFGAHYHIPTYDSRISSNSRLVQNSNADPAENLPGASTLDAQNNDIDYTANVDRVMSQAIKSTWLKYALIQIAMARTTPPNF